MAYGFGIKRSQIHLAKCPLIVQYVLEAPSTVVISLSCKPWGFCLLRVGRICVGMFTLAPKLLA